MNDDNVLAPNQTANFEQLYVRVAGHIQRAKQQILRTIDVEMVKAYWLTGRDIVQAEQSGQSRAGYGQFIIESLSKRLSKQFGKGFSVATLRNMRQFFYEYQIDSKYTIRYTVCSESGAPLFPPELGWSHYRELMRISNLEARAFYEIEACKNRWSVRELKRQKESLLFDRLAMSRDKEGFMRLVHQGQEISTPDDAIKDPVILEFLNLPEDHKLIESKVEEALLNNLQKFLLEMGSGVRHEVGKPLSFPPIQALYGANFPEGCD